MENTPAIRVATSGNEEGYRSSNTWLLLPESRYRSPQTSYLGSNTLLAPYAVVIQYLSATIAVLQQLILELTLLCWVGGSLEQTLLNMANEEQRSSEG